MGHEAVICIGSNVEPREARIDDAVNGIAQIARVIAVSGLRETPDVTAMGNSYINVVVRCATELDENEFATKLSAIEQRGGRRPTSAAEGIVEIDIDMVLWDGAVVSTSDFESEYFGPLFLAL